jgi:hypothetical protein
MRKSRVERSRGYFPSTSSIRGTKGSSWLFRIAGELSILSTPIAARTVSRCTPRWSAIAFTVKCSA